MLIKYMYLEIQEVVDTEEKWEGVISAPCVSFNVRREISGFGLGMSHCSIVTFVPLYSTSLYGLYY